MENASKALLIAAAVLVVIILVAIGMKIYSSTTETGKVATDTGKTISDKTGEATDIATYEITGKRPANPNIKYYEGETNNPKSQENAVPGDTIKIGDEKFMIFSKTATEIKAMPFYNITPTIDKPIQTKDANLAKFSLSSSEVYWGLNEDIRMEEKNENGSFKNNIQQYIVAYQETLKNNGAKEVKVRVATKSELEIDGVTDAMRNPCQSVFYQGFWIATSPPYAYNSVMYVDSKGKIYQYSICDYPMGVRPIIIIPI